MSRYNYEAYNKIFPRVSEPEQVESAVEMFKASESSVEHPAAAEPGEQKNEQEVENDGQFEHDSGIDN